MELEDFDRMFRFKMVSAYPTISGVANAYEAGHADIDAGFVRCLACKALRRTCELYVEEHRNGA